MSEQEASKIKSPYTLFLESIPRSIEETLSYGSSLTPNRISAITGYSHSTVKRHLNSMVHEEIAKEQRVGRVFLYTLKVRAHTEKTKTLFDFSK